MVVFVESRTGIFPVSINLLAFYHEWLRYSLSYNYCVIDSERRSSELLLTNTRPLFCVFEVSVKMI